VRGASLAELASAIGQTTAARVRAFLDRG
jgi:hypothetical protein